LTHWTIKYRLIILLVSIGLTAISLVLIRSIEVNPDLDSYVPDRMVSKLQLQELDSIFSGSEIVLVILKDDNVVKQASLERLKNLLDDFNSLEGIKQNISPFDAQNITIEDGFTLMEPIFEQLPETEQGYIQLRSIIKDNRMASRFFADDFTMVAVMLMKDPDYSDQSLIDNVKKVIAAHPGSEEVVLGGLPFIRYSISSYIKKDLVVLLPIALFLMIVMLLTSFREWKGVLIPLSIVVMSMVMSFGVMALLGWQMSLITILLPIMLIAIANDYGIHMIAQYQERVRVDDAIGMAEICQQVYQNLKRPIFITGITTIGGILGLLTHTMVPAAQLGILAAIGIAFALALSLWFLPALLSYLKPVRVRNIHLAEQRVPANRLLNLFSHWVINQPRLIVLSAVIMGIIGVIGAFYVRVDTNIESYFLGKSDVRHSIETVNEEFGGSQFISVLFSGDVLSPGLLKRMESYEKQLEEEPGVGTINSPVTLLKELSKGFYAEGEAGYDQLPGSADEAYQFIEVFSMSGNEEAIAQFFDYDFKHTRLLISLEDGSNSAGKRVLKILEDMTREDPNFEFIAGPGLTTFELADLVVKGQIRSLLLALVVIFLLLSLIFRSMKAGVLSVVPLSVAVLLLFGLMGVFGISLDIATALLSSIMIGVGVDYTIHFLWRFRQERTAGLTHADAIRTTLMTTGRGIIFNALSVMIGFLALTFSSFAPLRFFGALVTLSISTCLLSALLLVPALVLLIKPRFLESEASV
jgi:hydrophobe/amphiphile efflux-3 (HAE3) family protein